MMQYKTIEEIAFINPDSIKKGYPCEDIEYIDISSVGTGHLIESKAMPLSEASSRAKRLVEDKDTILSTVRPNRRSFLFIKKPRGNVVVSTGFAVLRAKNGTDPRYLYYAVTNQKFTDYLTLSAKGAAYPAVDTEIVQRGKIPYWPSEIQKKISAILAAYDDLIENNTRRIQILEEMAQRIYREWFVDFRFPGHGKVKFVDSEIGKIPDGWEVKRLSEIIETQYGYTESTSDKEIGPKFLRGMDINKNSYIDWDEVPYCKISDEELARYRLSKGDIVIIRMADPGKVGIVERDDINAVFASYLIRLKIKTRIHPYYLFCFLLSDRYQGYITGACTGTTRKSASAGVITNIDIFIPEKRVLDDFIQIIASNRALLNNLIQKNEKLRKSRDILLPKLISGEVDVSEMDIAIKEQDTKNGKASRI